MSLYKLWFDVEIGYYTTIPLFYNSPMNVVIWCRNWILYNPQLAIASRLQVVIWCRNWILYNAESTPDSLKIVVIWCRNWILYNVLGENVDHWHVVIWCRNWILYNNRRLDQSQYPLWFDVEIGYYTTHPDNQYHCTALWFDVEIGYYTTVRRKLL